MPALRNPRHERFAQLFHESGNARRSYVAAGYHASVTVPPNRRASSADAHASRLVRHGKVQSRLAELAAMTLKRHEITVDSLLADLESDRELAHIEGQGAAAVQATMAKARLLGLIVSRKEAGAPGEFAALATTQEVLAAIRNELGEQAADALARMLVG